MAEEAPQTGPSEDGGGDEGNTSSGSLTSQGSGATRKIEKKQGLTESLLHLRGTNKRLIMVTVGLPGRGKTFLAKKLARYLNWLSYSTKVFNIGGYRRELFGQERKTSDDPEKLKKCRHNALDDIQGFLKEGGNVAIYDGQNTKESDRDVVRQYIEEKMSLKATGLDVSLVWIEVMLTDPKVVAKNIKELHASSPDYASEPVAVEKVMEDMQKRITEHEKSYEPLGEANEQESYIQITNHGNKVVTNHIHGYLMGKIVFFLMSMRGSQKDIYISRHGESQYNTMGKLGGDSSLSPRGQQYAHELAKYLKVNIQPEIAKQNQELSVWCSTLRRTQETSQHVEVDEVTPWRALAEIDAGVCEHLTLEEIDEKYPAIAAERKADKLRYRYPQGESYEDVICRLEPVLFELNRMNGPVLVVGHRAVLRCLYAYFLDIPCDEIPHLSVPLHTVIKITPRAYGCDEERIPLGIPSVDDAVADEKGFADSNHLPEIDNKKKDTV